MLPEITSSTIPVRRWRYVNLHIATKNMPKIAAYIIGVLLLVVATVPFTPIFTSFTKESGAGGLILVPFILIFSGGGALTGLIFLIYALFKKSEPVLNAPVNSNYISRLVIGIVLILMSYFRIFEKVVSALASFRSPPPPAGRASDYFIIATVAFFKVMLLIVGIGLLAIGFFRVLKNVLIKKR